MSDLMVRKDSVGRLILTRKEFRTLNDEGAPSLKPVRKVVAGAVTSVALIVVVAVLGAVTPEMLTFAGQWSALIYAAVVALGGSLASYIAKPNA